MKTGFETAVELLPPYIAQSLSEINSAHSKAIQEIRFRVGRPACFVCGGENFFLQNGALTKNAQGANLTLNTEEIRELFLFLCGFSVHSFEEQLAQGFIPLAHGHRAGVCGKAVYREGKLSKLDSVTSINFRVASGTRFKLANEIEKQLFESNGGLLIAGPPASGKTSILRSILWALEGQTTQVTLVDEREEVLPAQNGEFIFGAPLNCDVLSGFRKAQGLLQAVRLLSPGVIVCDEIGTQEEAQAVTMALHAGARVIASIHCDDAHSLFERQQAALMLSTGAFSAVAVLKGRHAPGEVLKMEAINGGS